MTRQLSSVVLALLLVVNATSQVDRDGYPLSWNIAQSVVNSSIWQDVAAPDIAALLAEDEVAMLDKSIPMRFAYSSPIDFNLENSGHWTNLHNGDRIWVLGLSSAFAYSLSLSFSQFQLPQGAKLYIYTENHADYIGPFSSKDNRSSVLNTPPIHADRIVVEYYEPYAHRGDGNIEISGLSYAYRDLKNGNVSGSNECIEFLDRSQVNTRVADASSAVLMMIVDNGQRIATGTLLNNTSNDATPYILTAGSALIGQPSGWVFLFDVSGSECLNQNTACWSVAICGAQVVSNDNVNGSALLRLQYLPKKSWTAYYCGWRLNTASTSNAFMALQHAFGMPQSISAYSGVLASGYTNFTAANREAGGTFTGSVGSPLFDEDLNLVGVYLGGDSDCQMDGYDNFATFSSSWQKFGQYLDPFALAPDRLGGIFPQVEEPGTDDRPFEVFFFPNPSDGLIYVQNESDDVITTIVVRDAAGRLVRNFKPQSPGIDLSDLPKGLYSITFFTTASSSTQSLLLR